MYIEVNSNFTQNPPFENGFHPNLHFQRSKGLFQDIHVVHGPLEQVQLSNRKAD